MMEHEPVKIPVSLTAYEWHIVLNMLENYLSVTNASRFSGVNPDNAIKVFEHIATQLASQQRDAE